METEKIEYINIQNDDISSATKARLRVIMKDLVGSEIEKNIASLSEKVDDLNKSINEFKSYSEDCYSEIEEQQRKIKKNVLDKITDMDRVGVEHFEKLSIALASNKVVVLNTNDKVMSIDEAQNLIKYEIQKINNDDQERTKFIIEKLVEVKNESIKKVYSAIAFSCIIGVISILINFLN